MISNSPRIVLGVVLIVCGTSGALCLGQEPGVPLKRSAKDIFKYEEVKRPVIGTLIPNLKLRAPGKCGFFGMQYGPRAREVAYVVLDHDPVKGVFDRLFVYVPGHATYGGPFMIKGRVRRRTQVKFKPFVLNAEFGPVKTVFTVYVVSDGLTSQVLVENRVTEAGRTLCTFKLERSHPSPRGIGGEARVSQILSAPTLTCVMDHRSDPPKLAGQLEMGKWDMTPGSKMPGKLTALVEDMAGKDKIRKRSRLQRMSEGRYRFGPQRRMIPGNTYKAHLRLELGPLFGTIKVDKKLTPKK